MITELVRGITEGAAYRGAEPTAESNSDGRLLAGDEIRATDEANQLADRQLRREEHEADAVGRDVRHHRTTAVLEHEQRAVVEADRRTVTHLVVAQVVDREDVELERRTVRQPDLEAHHRRVVTVDAVR